MTDAEAKVAAFYDADGDWTEELSALRAVLRDCEVDETFKWRAPTYTAHGGNVATVWRMKDGAALALFKGALLADPEGVLVAPGEHSRSMRYWRFSDATEITDRAAAIKALVQEAVANEKAGRKVDFPKDDLAYPEELVDRLEADPDLMEAFEGLTPGRRRGYLLHFSQAKQSATRLARIEKHAPRILEGKGMHDR